MTIEQRLKVEAAIGTLTAVYDQLGDRLEEIHANPSGAIAEMTVLYVELGALNAALGALKKV